MAEDPRYATNAMRLQHREALIATLQRRLHEKSTGEWLALLLAAGIPASAIHSTPFPRFCRMRMFSAAEW